MKRRTRWILRVSVGIPVLLIGGLLLGLHLSSPSPELSLSAIDVKELPDIWIEEPSQPDRKDAQELSASIEETASRPTIENLELPISGTLVMMGDERPFGEETFQIAIEEDDVVLGSNGRFWFKALVATIEVAFDQTLVLDSDLRPRMFSSVFDAPLGFGRSMHTEFEDTHALVQSGDDVSEYPVRLDQAFVLGTFSTYAIIPFLYELRQPEGVVSLDVLVFGGRSNQDEEGTDDGLPEMRVEKIEDGSIRFDGQALAVSRYILSGDMGAMMLYARGVELLGLYADGDEDWDGWVSQALTITSDMPPSLKAAWRKAHISLLDEAELMNARNLGKLISNLKG